MNVGMVSRTTLKPRVPLCGMLLLSLCSWTNIVCIKTFVDIINWYKSFGLKISREVKENRVQKMTTKGILVEGGFDCSLMDVTQTKKCLS